MLLSIVNERFVRWATIDVTIFGCEASAVQGAEELKFGERHRCQAEWDILHISGGVHNHPRDLSHHLEGPLGEYQAQAS